MHKHHYHKIILAVITIIVITALTGCRILDVINSIFATSEPLADGKYYSEQELEDLFLIYKDKIKEILPIVTNNKCMNEIIDKSGYGCITGTQWKDDFKEDEWGKITNLFKHLELSEIRVHRDNNVSFLFPVNDEGFKTYIVYSASFDGYTSAYLFNHAAKVKLLENNWWLAVENNDEEIDFYHAYFDGNEWHNPPDYENE